MKPGVAVTSSRSATAPDLLRQFATPLYVRYDESPADPLGTVICVHGLTQNGSIFKPLVAPLLARGLRVVAVDLRGHGSSVREPPWRIETHVEDLRLTAERLGAGTAIWVGHSFGGRIIATLAAARPEQVERLVLLDPAFEIAGRQALQQAELHGRDWSFATIDGAVNALLSAHTVTAAPRPVIVDYVEQSTELGPDGRVRFAFSRSAVIAAWGEMALPAPVVADVPTLTVRAKKSLLSCERDGHYRTILGANFAQALVPNGHNMLWDSPIATVAAIEGFLNSAGPKSTNA